MGYWLVVTRFLAREFRVLELGGRHRGRGHAKMSSCWEGVCGSGYVQVALIAAVVSPISMSS